MGGRFCSLDQTYSECESTLVEIMIQPRNRMKTKKRVFTAIWDYIRPDFVEFIRADRQFFVWSSSAEISMGERIARIFDRGGPNHKSHAMTSSETSAEEFFVGQTYRRMEDQKPWPGVGT